MYHILAAQRQRQYGSLCRQNQTLAAAAFFFRSDPPGLVELASALVAGVGGVEQQDDFAAAGGDLDPLGAEEEVAGARLQAKPVERRLAKRRLDPFAEIGGDRDRAGLERPIERALQLALCIGRIEHVPAAAQDAITDCLDLGQDRLGLVIGDIAGKGMPAALLMANLQANLRSQCATAVEQPERFLQTVNRLFFESTADNAYATFFYSEFDDGTGRLRYANCGHLPALVLRGAGEVERLEPTATVLGLFSPWECRTAELRLSAGDLLAIYTDGITEAFDAREDEFGEERLVETLHAHRELPPRDLIAAIYDSVRRFSPQEQRDDMTLIVARCRNC